MRIAICSCCSTTPHHSCAVREKSSKSYVVPSVGMNTNTPKTLYSRPIHSAAKLRKSSASAFISSVVLGLSSSRNTSPSDISTGAEPHCYTHPSCMRATKLHICRRLNNLPSLITIEMSLPEISFVNLFIHIIITCKVSW